MKAINQISAETLPMLRQVLKMVETKRWPHLTSQQKQISKSIVIKKQRKGLVTILSRSEYEL